MKSWVGISLLATAVVVTASGKQPKHRWEYITFASIQRSDGVVPYFLVGYGEKSYGLRLDVDGPGPDFFKTNRLSARVHRASGQVLEADRHMLNSPGGAGSFGIVQWSVTAFFPWGTNSMDESWIDVSVGEERYWLEIPYGFDRDPRQPLSSSSAVGPPKFCPAMKKSPLDHVIHWSSVHYDLGKIQNRWRLSLIQSNPGDGQTEVQLYRDDSAVGKSVFLWDLYSPRTNVRVLEAGQLIVGAHCMGIRLHEDGMRRSDTYALGRTGFGDRRSWGEVEITVGDRSYRTVVPSSVYEYGHGHARDD